MRNYNPKRPTIPACGLIEDDPEEFEEEGILSDAPSFPLKVFPEAIRNIVEAFEEYENFNVDFTAASFLTVFAAAMGNTWSVRFMTGWIDLPIIYMVLVGSPSCGKTPPLQQAVAPLLKIDSANMTGYIGRRWRHTEGGNVCQRSNARKMHCPRKWLCLSISVM